MQNVNLAYSARALSGERDKKTNQLTLHIFH